jgi:hypothetical protein
MFILEIIIMEREWFLGSRRLFYTLLTLCCLALVSFVVVSQSFPYSGTIPNPGHGGDTVLVSVNGVEKSLQQAIDDGDFASSGGGSTTTTGGSSEFDELRFVQGVVEITGWDPSGSDEYCWFRVLVDGAQYFPPGGSCSGNGCKRSPDLDEINIGKCHNYIQWYLSQNLNNIFMQGKIGENVAYTHVKKYHWEGIPGVHGLGTNVYDGAFELEYVKQSEATQTHFTCPLVCPTFSQMGSHTVCILPDTTPVVKKTYSTCCTSTTTTSSGGPGGGGFFGTTTTYDGGCWPEYGVV